MFFPASYSLTTPLIVWVLVFVFGPGPLCLVTLFCSTAVLVLSVDASCAKATPATKVPAAIREKRLRLIECIKFSFTICGVAHLVPWERAGMAFRLLEAG